jgi:probable phosphomutase (TIGR03848 family)
VAVLLLIRHGVTADTGKRLYGRSPGIHLSDAGRAQAERVAERLRPLPLEAIYSSPLDRCTETAGPIAAGRGLEVRPLPEMEEVDYGRWTGRTFASLSRTRLWRRVHRAPSGVRFPGGEALAEAQRRSVEALEQVAERHSRRPVAVVSHGDPIRLALAHFAGIHLDLFQRLEVHPGSVSAVALSDGVGRVLRVNDTGTLEDLAPPPRPRRR